MDPGEKQQGEISITETEVTVDKLVISQTPATGKRSAFKNVIRQLTDEELKSPGVQKIILDELEQVENERDEIKKYQDLYHAADKRACVSEERLRTNASIEVAFGVGMAIGGTLIGLTPSLTSLEVLYKCMLIGFGIILIIGAIVVRVIKR